MNNIIERIWKQGGLVNIEDLRGTAFQAEESAHTFRIRGVDESGEPLALTGTCAAIFLRADNTDVAITGTITDGAAEITLTDECYDMPGRFGLTIYVTSDEQTVAVYAAIGSVYRTSSGVVSPETGEDVTDLINAIAAAVATIPASYTDLMAAVAPTYSTSAIYAVGSYAWYDGKLYRCTTAITSGETWTSAHWTQANLGSDVSDLKSALSNAIRNRITQFTLNKYLNTVNGGESVANGWAYTPKMYFEDNSIYTIEGADSGFKIGYVILYDVNGTFLGYISNNNVSISSSTIISANKNTAIVGFDILKSGYNTPLTDESVANWVFICKENAYSEIDEIKANIDGIEDDIDGIEDDITDIGKTDDALIKAENGRNKEFVLNKYLTPTGAEGSADGWAYTNPVPITSMGVYKLEGATNGFVLVNAVYRDKSGAVLASVGVSNNTVKISDAISTYPKAVTIAFNIRSLSYSSALTEQFVSDWVVTCKQEAYTKIDELVVTDQKIRDELIRSSSGIDKKFVLNKYIRTDNGGEGIADGWAYTNPVPITSMGVYHLEGATNGFVIVNAFFRDISGTLLGYIAVSYNTVKISDIISTYPKAATISFNIRSLSYSSALTEEFVANWILSCKQEAYDDIQEIKGLGYANKPVFFAKRGTTYYVKSEFDSQKDYANTFEIETSGNKILNFLKTIKLNKMNTKSADSIISTINGASSWKACGDDIAPCRINDMYIGGNHGNPRFIKIFCSHDKTEVDVGSVWNDGTYDYTIIYVGSDYLIVGSIDNDEVRSWRLLGSPLTHVSGATHTNNITQTAQEPEQLRPCGNYRQHTITDQDGNPLDENGAWCDKVIVHEKYNVLDGVAVIKYLQEHAGSNDNTSYYDNNITDSLVVFDNVYEFNRNGSITIYGGLLFVKPCNFSFYAFSQSQKIANSQLSFVPESTNFATPVANGAVTTDITFSGKIPYRYYQIASDYSTGFGIVYDTRFGYGKQTKRSDYCTVPGTYQDTYKLYPYMVSPEDDVPAGSYFYGVAARMTILSSTTIPTLAWYWTGNDVVVMVDVASGFNGFIELPDYLHGMEIEELDVSSDITVYNDIVTTSGIKIKNNGNSINHAVLRLYN